MKNLKKAEKNKGNKKISLYSLLMCKLKLTYLIRIITIMKIQVKY